MKPKKKIYKKTVKRLLVCFNNVSNLKFQMIVVSNLLEYRELSVIIIMIFFFILEFQYVMK